MRSVILASVLLFPAYLAQAADCPGAYDLEDCDVGESVDVCDQSSNVLTCYLFDLPEGAPGGSIVAVSDYDNGGVDKVSVWGVQPDGQSFCCTHNQSTSGFNLLHVNGSRGDDYITFNWAGDTLRESPQDWLMAMAWANDGVDHIYGSTRLSLDYTDVLHGGDGADYLQGNEGHDVLFSGGGSGLDVMYGQEGDDYFKCDSSCEAHGGFGNDDLDGSDSADELHGGPDKDTICGRGGADNLFGGGRNDHIWGGAGNDTVDGGPGTDWCTSPQGNCENEASTGCSLL